LGKIKRTEKNSKPANEEDLYHLSQMYVPYRKTIHLSLQRM